MITLNNRPMEYEQGMTIKKLIELMNYTYPTLIVRVNGELFENYNEINIPIKDGDFIEILHPICGG